MRKAMLLLIVLAIGLPSYGALFVYNLEMNFKGAMNGLAVAVKDVNIYDESDFKQITKKTPKAYMVLDINDADGNDLFVENTGLIPYNVIEKTYIDDATIETLLLRLANRNAKYHHLWILDCIASNAVDDVNNLDTQNIGLSSARIIGKAFTDQKLRFVREDTGEVASTISGIGILDTGIFSPVEMYGTTTIKASLYTTFTRQINNPNNPEFGGITFSGVVEELKMRLSDQGYTPITQGD